MRKPARIDRTQVRLQKKPPPENQHIHRQLKLYSLLYLILILVPGPNNLCIFIAII